MRDLKSWLKEGDPLTHEHGLSPAEVQRMREKILSASAAPQHRSRRVFLAIAATLLLGTVGAALVARASLHRPTDVPSKTVIPAPASTTRQLQFVAPGGTRLIWTFNPNLSVR